MSLMPLEHGRYFYHYTKWKTASEKIIPTGKLRLSPYARMSDPLEAMAPMLGAGVSYSPGDEEAATKLGLAHVEAQEELGRLRSCTKVLSLTVDAAWAANVPEVDRDGLGAGPNVGTVRRRPHGWLPHLRQGAVRADYPRAASGALAERPGRSRQLHTHRPG